MKSDKPRIAKAQTERLALLTAYYLMERYDPFFTEAYRRKVVRLLALHRSNILADICSGKIALALLRKALPEVYPLAVLFASERMGRRASAFPQSCPVTLKNLLDTKALPKAKMLVFEAWQPTSGADISADWSESGFHVTQLDQETTGLPMMVWALERIVSKDVCAVVVASTYQERRKAKIKSGVLVSVGPKPKVLFDGKLRAKDQAMAAKFVAGKLVLTKEPLGGQRKCVVARSTRKIEAFDLEGQGVP